MPTYQNIINSVRTKQDNDAGRQGLIKEIENLTGRRLLVYVANFNRRESMLTLEDKTGFSDLIQDIREENVDILINSPGGFAEVTEVIVGMLRAKFKSIRFAIPNRAKSAATLLVLSGDALMMDSRSELGPIDPQIEYLSTEGRKRESVEDILDGFDKAKEVLAKEGPTTAPAYIPLLNKYTIGLLRACETARELSKTLAKTWLKQYMFAGEKGSRKPWRISSFLAKRAKTLSHNRAILIDKCIELDIEMVDLRKPEHAKLREQLWRLWCLYELLFEKTVQSGQGVGHVYKMYENSSGCILHKITQAQLIQVPMPPQAQKQHPSPLLHVPRMIAVTHLLFDQSFPG